MSTTHVVFQSPAPSSYEDVLDLFWFEERLISKETFSRLVRMLPLESFVNIKKIFLFDIETSIFAIDRMSEKELLEFQKVTRTFSNDESVSEQKDFFAYRNVETGLGYISFISPDSYETSDFMKNLLMLLRFSQLASDKEYGTRLLDFLNDGDLPPSQQKESFMFPFEMSDMATEYAEEVFEKVFSPVMDAFSGLLKHPESLFNHFDEVRSPSHLHRDPVKEEDLVPGIVSDENLISSSRLQELFVSGAGHNPSYRFVLKPYDSIREDKDFVEYGAYLMGSLKYEPFMIFPERGVTFINLSDPMFASPYSLTFNLLKVMFTASYYHDFNSNPLPVPHGDHPQFSALYTKHVALEMAEFKKASQYGEHLALRVLGIPSEFDA